MRVDFSESNFRVACPSHLSESPVRVDRRSRLRLLAAELSPTRMHASTAVVPVSSASSLFLIDPGRARVLFKSRHWCRHVASSRDEADSGRLGGLPFSQTSFVSAVLLRLKPRIRVANPSRQSKSPIRVAHPSRERPEAARGPRVERRLTCCPTAQAASAGRTTGGVC